jgi:imidazoleglycerol phosphate dehydratase HisB
MSWRRCFVPRRAELSRKTGETEIEVVVDLDGAGNVEVVTGLGFLDHMMSALGKHARVDLRLRAEGDTDVDDHHTVEDCAIVLGRALDQALGDRTGINRFGHSYAPLDESLTRAVVDLSGRPWPEISIPFRREKVGEVANENIVHFFRSLALETRMALHVDVIRGDNDHHMAESAFKAVALALRMAITPSVGGLPSTKGILG